MKSIRNNMNTHIVQDKIYHVFSKICQVDFTISGRVFSKDKKKTVMGYHFKDL